MAKRTPEEIDAMEQEVKAYRADEARAAARKLRTDAKPLTDMLADGTLRRVLDTLPTLETLAADRDRFPNLRPYINAARSGVEGLLQVATSLSETAAE